MPGWQLTQGALQPPLPWDPNPPGFLSTCSLLQAGEQGAKHGSTTGKFTHTKGHWGFASVDVGLFSFKHSNTHKDEIQTQVKAVLAAAAALKG